LRLAQGLVTVAVVGGKEYTFSEKAGLPGLRVVGAAAGAAVVQLQFALWSLPACNGLGSKYDFDPAKVIVDWTRPLFDGGLAPGRARQS